MASKKKGGRPAGEVLVGTGFDEKLKRLSEVYADKNWTYPSENYGPINHEVISSAATEQEKDQKQDSEAWVRYQQIHEPVMKRQGLRGAMYSEALTFARTVAKGNRDLIRVLGELRIRSGKRRRAADVPAA